MFLRVLPPCNWLLLLLLPAAPPTTPTIASRYIQARSLHFMTGFIHHWPFYISDRTTSRTKRPPRATHIRSHTVVFEPRSLPNQRFFACHSTPGKREDPKQCQRTHRLHRLLHHRHPGWASSGDRARSAANSGRWCSACCFARTAFIANEHVSSSTLGKEGTTLQRCKQRRER
jgi:hypothetical protein